MFDDREYQTAALEAIQREFLTVQSTLLEQATGTGKTVVFGRLVKSRLPKRALILAHRNELIVQAKEKMEEICGCEVEIEKADQYANTHHIFRAPIVVSSIQTQCSGPKDNRRYRRFNPNDFATVVADECFVPGTMIDGKPIKSITIGDVVTTHKGAGIVKRIFRQICSELIELKFNDGRCVISTLNHPFWTQRGFITAGELTSDDVMLTITRYEEMHNLRRSSKQQTLHQPCMQIGNDAQEYKKHVQEIWRTDHQISKDQRNAQAGSESVSIHQTSGHGLEANNPERKRNWSNNSTASDGGGAGMEYGDRDPHQANEREWLSDLLQGGCWKFRSENSNRGGWEFSRCSGEEGSRREESFFFEFTGLESVKILQRGRHQRFEQVCPDGVVYNLEVSNGNTYFANGVLVHNCHHSTANSWRETIDHYLQNPNCRLLGVTATSDRADGEALGQVFKTVAYKYGILDAIRDGYLVDVTQQFVKVGNLDFSHIKTTQGDLNEAELSRIMQSEDVIQRVCQASLEAMFALKPKTLSEVPVPEWGHFFRELKRHPRRTIVFTVSVPQAEMTANIFSRVMGGVEWVCGATKKETRADILGRFKTGETSVCVNCQVLTEGYDNPQVELIIMARPTKSRSLYAQMVGRSTRTLPGVVDDIPEADVRRLLISQSAKPFCRVLDFVGNSGKHKLVSVADILGGHVSEAAAEEAKKVAMSKESPVKMMVTMSNAEIELERQRQAAMDKARKLEEGRKSHLLAKTDFHITDVDPFSHRHERIPIDKRHSKDGRIFSENQAKVLRLAGCDPSRFGYKQGQAIIAGYYKKHPASPRQLEILRDFGFDPSDWSHQQVKSALEKLKQNNWRTVEV